MSGAGVQISEPQHSLNLLHPLDESNQRLKQGTLVEMVELNKIFTTTDPLCRGRQQSICRGGLTNHAYQGVSINILFVGAADHPSLKIDL
jgi:hypothetical protein